MSFVSSDRFIRFKPVFLELLFSVDFDTVSAISASPMDVATNVLNPSSVANPSTTFLLSSSSFAPDIILSAALSSSAFTPSGSATLNTSAATMSYITGFSSMPLISAQVYSSWLSIASSSIAFVRLDCSAICFLASIRANTYSSFLIFAGTDFNCLPFFSQMTVHLPPSSISSHTVTSSTSCG